MFILQRPNVVYFQENQKQHQMYTCSKLLNQDCSMKSNQNKKLEWFKKVKVKTRSVNLKNKFLKQIFKKDPILKYQNMIIIDAAIFLGIVAALHYYKSTHPNFLFFCKGAILFLPPDDDDQQPQPNQNNNKSNQKTSKQQKQGHQISVIQVEYNHVKTYPFCTEYERIAMTLVGLLLFYIVRLPLSFVLPEISLLTFYILIAILVYTVKVSVDTFMVSAYKTKVVFLISVGINLFYFFLVVAFSNYEGVFDQTIKFIAGDYSKRLQIVLGLTQPLESNTGSKLWINHYTVMGFVVFVNFFITLAAIPSIVKFGNWYSKTLKEVYYQEDQEQQKMHSVLNGNKESNKQTQRQLKLNSQNTISLLNYYLISSLLFVVFSHRFVNNYIPQVLVIGLRMLFLGVSTWIILWTAKEAIQFNGSFAYKSVMEYFKQKSKQGRALLRRKIVPYIYHIWYHYHQFMYRVMIPLLLVLLIVHWRYLAVPNEEFGTTNEQIMNNNKSNMYTREINTDVQCGVSTNQMNLLRQLYRCRIRSYRQMQMQVNRERNNIISGEMRSSSSTNNQTPNELQQRIMRYGLLQNEFMVQLIQLLLWYSSITMYGMTVVYVLFLRKTVYEI